MALTAAERAKNYRERKRDAQTVTNLASRRHGRAVPPGLRTLIEILNDKADQLGFERIDKQEWDTWREMIRNRGLPPVKIARATVERDDPDELEELLDEIRTACVETDMFNPNHSGYVDDMNWAMEQRARNGQDWRGSIA